MKADFQTKKMKFDLDKNQLTIADALMLIDSKECKKFDIHYRYLHGNVKGNIYYSDCLDDDPDLSVEKFIADADNYGSFWLTVYYDEVNEEFKMFQIVDNNTFEPL